MSAAPGGVATIDRARVVVVAVDRGALARSAAADGVDAAAVSRVQRSVATDREKTRHHHSGARDIGVDGAELPFHDAVRVDGVDRRRRRAVDGSGSVDDGAAPSRQGLPDDRSVAAQAQDAPCVEDVGRIAGSQRETERAGFLPDDRAAGVDHPELLVAEQAEQQRSVVTNDRDRDERYRRRGWQRPANGAGAIDRVKTAVLLRQVEGAVGGQGGREDASFRSRVELPGEPAVALERVDDAPFADVDASRTVDDRVSEDARVAARTRPAGGELPAHRSVAGQGVETAPLVRDVKVPLGAGRDLRRGRRHRGRHRWCRHKGPAPRAGGGIEGVDRIRAAPVARVDRSVGANHHLLRDDVERELLHGHLRADIRAAACVGRIVVGERPRRPGRRILRRTARRPVKRAGRPV